MVKRTIFLAMALWFCLTGAVLAAYPPPPMDAQTAIQTYAEMYVFGDSERRDKIISPQEMHGRMTARLIVNLMEVFQDYPLSEETFAQIQDKYLKKIQQNVNLQTQLKSENGNSAIVAVTANSIDYSAIAEMAANDTDLQSLKAEVKQFNRADKKFQSRAAEVIGNFIEKIPAGKTKTIDINCKLEGGNWIPSDNGKSLSNFLVTDIFPNFYRNGSNVPDISFDKPPVIDNPSVINNSPVIENQPTYAANDKWLIYWYVCGSDIESNNGAASKDIAEIEAVKLPSNVRVIMQLGGAREWQDKRFNNHALGRWIYDSTGMHLLENAPDANMGDESTLENFIDFGENYNANNFQADHKIFIFWDHGAGNMGGVCLDDYNPDNETRYSRNHTNYLPGEKPNRQTLTLNYIQTAFKNKSASKFEIIGFDTCLGANYEYANAIADFANYMVASEANEPNCGWYYTNWLSDLSKNPAIDARDLSKKICDSFMYGVKVSDRNNGKQESLTATLSAFDLSKIPQLRTAYENYGKEALNKFNQNSYFGANLRRAAVNAQKYSSHVDLEGLALNTKDILSNSDNLIYAIKNARVYKSHGDMDKGNGLGAYFLYSGTVPQSYLEQNARPQNMTKLFQRIENDYSYRWDATDGTSTKDVKQGDTFDAESVNQYIAAREAMAATIQTKLSKTGGLITAQVPKQHMPYISEVNGVLIRARVANRRDSGKKVPVFLHLGTNTGVSVNWKTGEVESKFDGTWAKLNGHMIAMYQDAYKPKFDSNHKIIGGYNIYKVPILVNGKNFYWLKVAYNYSNKKYSTIGVESIINNDAIAGRENISLNAGDTIQPWAMGTFFEEAGDGDAHSVLVKEDFLPIEAPFQITGDLEIKSEILENGRYGYCFNFEDMHGLDFNSGAINFSMYNGEINPDDHIVGGEGYDPNLHMSDDGNTHAILPYDLESAANSVIEEIEAAENRK